MKGDSAQITIDYIAGIGIFLLSVIFVFQFMYGLFIPFQSGSDEVTLAADRASIVLVERILSAGTGAPNVVDEGKFYNFNNRLNSNYNDALREIGLFGNEIMFDLNISAIYLNGTMMSGPEVPENTDVGQTKRLVLIVNSTNGNETYAIISVSVW